MKIKSIIFRLIILSILLWGCSKKAEPNNNIQKPDFKDLTVLLDRENYLDAVLIMHNNKIVYRYFKNEDSKTTVYNFYSCAKSITALILGIAIDEGFISSENQPIIKYFSQIKNTDKRKEQITIQHLLSMTSGINWPESTDWHHFFGPMIQSGNWIDFILRRDMETSPGARFNY
ncbi:MAG: serine hydrolase, partial [Spirochaetia bacterium]